jgi:hypothetical protein
LRLSGFARNIFERISPAHRAGPGWGQKRKHFERNQALRPAKNLIWKRSNPERDAMIIDKRLKKQQNPKGVTENNATPSELKI